MNRQSERTRIAMKRFLDAYEESFGNVSASCRYAGISRKTFYRWMEGTSPRHRRFQRRFALTMPKERFMGLVQSALMKKVEEGNTRAIIFALRLYGGDRGYR